MNNGRNAYWAYLLALAFIVGITIMMIYFFWVSRRFNHSEKTKKSVSRTLRSMAPLREWKVMDNITIADRKGREYTADHLVIGPFGVLALTDLHQQGGYYGELRDAEWVLSSGGEGKIETYRLRVPSPVKNNEGFVAAFRERLTAAEVYNVPVEALCALTQNHVDVFVTGAKDLLVYPGKLRDTLSRQKYQKDNGVDIEKIASLLPGE